jgi:hypothetical protein
MTAKAVTISNDSIRPSDFARNLYLPTNPFHSFKVLPIRKQAYVIIIALIATVAGMVFAISQVFGEGGQSSADNSSSGNTSSSSNHQPPKGQPDQPSSSSNNSAPQSTSNSSNTSSTSITVNGQSVDVPQAGSYDKNVNVPGGNVHVSGNTSQSTTGGSASNSTTTNVEINSE